MHSLVGRYCRCFFIFIFSLCFFISVYSILVRVGFIASRHSFFSGRNNGFSHRLLFCFYLSKAYQHTFLFVFFNSLCVAGAYVRFVAPHPPTHRSLLVFLVSLSVIIFSFFFFYADFFLLFNSSLGASSAEDLRVALFFLIFLLLNVFTQKSIKNE